MPSATILEGAPVKADPYVTVTKSSTNPVLVEEGVYMNVPMMRLLCTTDEARVRDPGDRYRSG